MNCVTVYVFILSGFCVALYPCEEHAENEQKVLDTHNKYRKIHDAPAMSINSEMSAKAAEWAKHLASTGTFQHASTKTRNGDGENLYFGCGSISDRVEESTNAWYKEVCDYSFDSPKNSTLRTGHFTQMVWKTSQQLGVGVATGKKYGMDCTYVVTRYRLHGNIVGEFSDNVHNGTFDKSFCNTAVQNDGSGSGSGSGQGSGSFDLVNGIERGNRWKHLWGSGSGQASASGQGSGESGDAEKDKK